MLKMKNLLGLFVIVFALSSSVCAKDFRFVQVSDARYSASNSAVMSKLINDINNQKNVQFVVFTGDNVQRANPELLESFVSELNKIKVPCYVVLGDKDVNKYRNMSKKEYCEYLKKHLKGYKYINPNYVFEKRGIVFMAVDGTKDVIPGTNGFYRDNVVGWVDANLDLYSDKPVVIFQHFPLLAPDERDNYQTYKPEKYLEVLKKHKNVIAVISGHYGVNNEIESDGIEHISTAPLPEYRIIDIIDYETDKPTIWGEVKRVEK